jgi:hypothetical protein
MLLIPGSLPVRLKPRMAVAARDGEGVGAMTDQPLGRERLADFAHRVLERLTVMKIHVGALRLHLHRDSIDPAEAEKRLDQIEEQIDATAALAHEIHGEKPLSP